jgi:hypothetical protein
MKTEIKLPAALLLLMSPLAANAIEGTPHIELFAFGGGALGGFLGALVACWLCNRMRSKSDKDSQK